MKIIRNLLISLVLMVSTYTKAQTWELLNPKPTANDFSALDFINDSTGFFVSNRGEIFKTTNRGESFELNFYDPEAFFSGVRFPTSDTGFAMGYHSLYHFVIRTIDGGLTWQEFPFLGGVNYSDINFVDNNHGWICGWYKTIIRTTNGGNSWQGLSGHYLNENHFNCCDFINHDTGFFAGQYGYSPDSAILFITTNGGLTLTPITLPDQSCVITDIKAFNDKEILLCEGRAIDNYSWLYHTSDGGITWNTINLGTSTIDPEQIQFIDSLNSIIFCSDGCIITNDGWQTFTKVYYSYYWDAIRAGIMTNDSIVYACGQGGLIVYSANGGNTWTEKSSGFRGPLTDIEFWNETHGCVAGNIKGSDFIAYTTDGGYNWQESSFEHTNNAWIKDLTHISGDELWAAGDPCIAFHSLNGGQSWERSIISTNDQDWITNLEHLPNNRIYAGGNSLFYTDDEGLSWQKSDFICGSNYSIKDILFTDSQNGFLILHSRYPYGSHSGKLFKTTDGGNSWTGIPFINNDSLRILSASFINSQEGIINLKDQRIFKTTDGGENWVQCNYNGLYYIVYLKMFDDKNVVASGFDFVMYSFDGGINWTPVNPQGDYPNNFSDQEDLEDDFPLVPGDITDLYGRCFLTMGTGWSCADGGVIKKYTDLFVNNRELTKTVQLPALFSPNPTTGTIRFDETEKPEQVIIFDNNGKIIFNEIVKNSLIDVSFLPTGNYLMKLIKGSQQRSTNLIKL